MKSIMSCAFLFVPLLFTGCGMSEQEAALVEMIDCMDEMTDILETVQDENSAVLAKPKLEKLGKQMETALDEASECWYHGVGGRGHH